MLEIKLTEMPLQNLILEPEERITKGDNQLTEPLFKRLALGGPEIIPITTDKAGDDEELRHFLENEDNKFHLIHLTCSFNPQENETFNSARVWIKLQRIDQAIAPKPIAWSMQPNRLSTTVKYTTTVNLGAEAKLLEIIGVESGAERSKEVEKKEIFLQAFNELGSDPFWQFKETLAEKIYGLHRLKLIVKHPKGVTIQGVVNIIADLKRKQWFGRSYKVPLDKSPHLFFTLT